jgi:hypothetical protein
MALTWSAGGMNHWKTLFRMTTSEPFRRSLHSKILLFTTFTRFPTKIFIYTSKKFYLNVEKIKINEKCQNIDTVLA